MILLFTDFAWDGPYVGQMKARLLAAGVGPVVDLMHDAPAFDPRASACLLWALARQQTSPAHWLAVVDPGVGGGRRAVALEADSHWWVGPDNGLFALVVRHATRARAFELPVSETAAPTFHGRDVFAPAIARLAQAGPGDWPAIDPRSLDRPSWPDDWPAVIYVDAFGNAMTGLRADRVRGNARIRVGEYSLTRARTFSERPPGEAFWYANSLGLVELAVNLGSAAERLGLRPGAAVQVLS